MPSRTPLRFRWDHRNVVHRRVVKVANRVLAKLPISPKYFATRIFHTRRPPYSLVSPGDVVVQVGAPSDTLLSGRSRGMHLALKSRGGRAIIIEPDPASADTFRRFAEQLGLDHVTVVNVGAWSEPSTLTLFVDPKHPATNFVDGTVDYSADRLKDFIRVDVPVLTLDQIVADVIGRHGPIRLLSVTTNNSEREILQGATEVFRSGLQYLCLARTGSGYNQVANDLGFRFLANDNRGYTFVRSNDR